MPARDYQRLAGSEGQQKDGYHPVHVQMASENESHARSYFCLFMALLILVVLPSYTFLNDPVFTDTCRDTDVRHSLPTSFLAERHQDNHHTDRRRLDGSVQDANRTSVKISGLISGSDSPVAGLDWYPSASNEFDCKAGLKHWRLGWSEQKKIWCCKHSKLAELTVGCDDQADKTQTPEPATPEPEPVDPVCHVNAQSYRTLLCGAAMLAFLKILSLERWSDLFPKMIGSTDAAKRAFPFGLAFRGMAIWSFWGMMFGIAMTIWKYEPHFSDSHFSTVKSNGLYYLVLEDADAAPLSAEDLPETCAAFDSYHDIRRFAYLAFGICETLVFLAGAFFFGVGELFKIDIAKGYLVQRVMALDFVGFYNTALVGDKLIMAFDEAISQAKNFSKKYGGDLDKIQATLENVEDLSLESLQGPAELFAGYARKAVLNSVKPKIEAKIEPLGLAWEDVCPILEELDTPEEIQNAVTDPMGFLKERSGDSGRIARKLAIAQLRPKIEPTLKDYGLDWADFKLILDEVDTVQEITNAMSDVTGFLKRLAEKLPPVARKFAMKAIRPSIELRVKEQGLEWADVEEDVENVFLHLDSVDDIQKAAADPVDFMKQVLGPVTIKVALKKLKPTLEPKLKPMNLSWEDAMVFLKEIDTVEEIEQAMANPDAFLETLKTGAGLVARKALMAQLRKTFEPTCLSMNLQWEDLRSVLEEIDTIEELREALQDPNQFMEQMGDKLMQKSKEAAMRWALAKIRAQLEPKLVENGVSWKDAVKIFKKLDSPQDLQRALADPVTVIQEVFPGQQEQAKKADEEETAKSVTNKAKQKMIWPGVTQAAAAALWLSVAYINIDPCVSYETSVDTTAMFGMMDLQEGLQFVTFLAIAHMVMLFAMTALLFAQIFSDSMGWLRIEKSFIVFMVLALMAYTVLLGTYEPPTKGAMGRKLAASLPADSSSILSILIAMPIGLYTIVGYGLEAVLTQLSTMFSRPSQEEMATYRAHRAAVIAKKSQTLVKTVPTQVKKQARTMSRVVRSVAKQVKVEPPAPAKEQRDTMFVNAFEMGKESDLGKVVGLKWEMNPAALKEYAPPGGYKYGEGYLADGNDVEAVSMTLSEAINAASNGTATWGAGAIVGFTWKGPSPAGISNPDEKFYFYFKKAGSDSQLSGGAGSGWHSYVRADADSMVSEVAEAEVAEAGEAEAEEAEVASARSSGSGPAEAEIAPVSEAGAKSLTPARGERAPAETTAAAAAPARTGLAALSEAAPAASPTRLTPAAAGAAGTSSAAAPTSLLAGAAPAAAEARDDASDDALVV
eukprot:TRINITY_DN15096_c0_g2_i2.p1 TRINITY_DN15096_c0_g2~~TRINITY_DN15096_c0_g2_i2.p1  ORF type:complete len:1296 (+),score=303.02 TRINITY_DN15096_c0_g2_i2:100-3987(+)